MFVAARHARGWYSQQELADAFEKKARELGLRIDVSVRQVRRWESAEPPWPTPEYLHVLHALFEQPLPILGFIPPFDADNLAAGNDTTACTAIRGLHATDQPGWWRTDPHEGDVDPRFGNLLTAEQSATAIRTYSAAIMPGLLQIYEYSIAVLRSHIPALPDEEVGLRADRRTRRLSAIGPKADGSRSMWFILDESALTNAIGGVDVLRAQLAHLLVVSTRRPDLRIQVLPDGLGAHPGLVGAFTVYDFMSRRVLHVEGLTGDSWSVRPSCVATYSLAYDHLLASALSVDDSMERIARRLAETETVWETTGDPSGAPAATRARTIAWRLRAASPSLETGSEPEAPNRSSVIAVDRKARRTLPDTVR
jgi:transcriptional regulator with XRE-family HTH domain